MSKTPTKHRYTRLAVPGIFGTFAVIMLIGGVSGSLVAGRTERAVGDPYETLLVWGSFGLALFVTVATGVWAVRRPKNGGGPSPGGRYGAESSFSTRSRS